VRYMTRRFKNLKLALKELQPFVNGRHLLSGRGFKQFHGMLPREMLANWLVCAAYNFDQGARLTFCSDPIGGDGIIVDTKVGKTWPTEHVIVPPTSGSDADDIETRILKAIERKRKKGRAAYASGKTLVVFLEGANGPWHPNKVAKRLPDPLHFEIVWTAGLQRIEAGEH